MRNGGGERCHTIARQSQGPQVGVVQENVGMKASDAIAREIQLLRDNKLQD